ncbi:MAG: hypothetical protein AB7M12_14350 [Hyphomonadaceae bacterium]
MTDTANEVRGEVDLTLDGTQFVLRPSHTAMIAIEKATGKSCLALAGLAHDGEITLGDATIITTEMIKAWGVSRNDPVASNVDAQRIGELIHEFGLMKVVMRIALVLTNAVTGGVKADGTPKEGEVMAAPGTIEIPGAAEPE